jgi:hypothetical protein
LTDVTISKAVRDILEVTQLHFNTIIQAAAACLVVQGRKGQSDGSLEK